MPPLTCPHCSSGQVKRVKHKGQWEQREGGMRIRHYRCQDCHRRITIPQEDSHDAA